MTEGHRVEVGKEALGIQEVIEEIMANLMMTLVEVVESGHVRRRDRTPVDRHHHHVEWGLIANHSTMNQILKTLPQVYYFVLFHMRIFARYIPFININITTYRYKSQKTFGAGTKNNSRSCKCNC